MSDLSNCGPRMDETSLRIPHYDLLHRENSLRRTPWSQWDCFISFFPNWEYFVSPQSQNPELMSSIGVFFQWPRKQTFGAVHNWGNCRVDNSNSATSVYETYLIDDGLPFLKWPKRKHQNEYFHRKAFSSSIALGDPWNWILRETSDFEGFSSLTWRWVISPSTSSLGWMP